MNAIIGSIVREILKLVPNDWLKDLVDGLFDKLEAKIKASPNKLDDAIVLPLIAKARELLNI